MSGSGDGQAVTGLGDQVIKVLPANGCFGGLYDLLTRRCGCFSAWTFDHPQRMFRVMK